MSGIALGGRTIENSLVMHRPTRSAIAWYASTSKETPAILSAAVSSNGKKVVLQWPRRALDEASSAAGVPVDARALAAQKVGHWDG